MEISNKYKAESDRIAREHPHVSIPTRGHMGDSREYFLAKYAKTHTVTKNDLCSRHEVLLQFFDEDGELVGGYYLRPDQVEYAVERIIA